MNKSTDEMKARTRVHKNLPKLRKLSNEKWLRIGGEGKHTGFSNCHCPIETTAKCSA